MVFNKSEDRVYVRDDQFEWLPAVVLEVEDDRVLVRIELPDDWNKTTCVPERGDTTGVPHSQLSNNDNEVRWVLLKDYYNHRLPLQNARLCRDIAELEHLHEAAILYQIKERHCNFDKPYTRVGEIIVAVNPCQWMHGLYSAERQQFYFENLTKAHSHYGT
jgi:myosin heavy subunit